LSIIRWNAATIETEVVSFKQRAIVLFINIIVRLFFRNRPHSIMVAHPTELKGSILLLAPVGCGDAAILRSLLLGLPERKRRRITILTKPTLVSFFRNLTTNNIIVFDHNWSFFDIRWLKTMWLLRAKKFDYCLSPGSWRNTRLDILALLSFAHTRTAMLRPKPRFPIQKSMDVFYHNIIPVPAEAHEITALKKMLVPLLECQKNFIKYHEKTNSISTINKVGWFIGASSQGRIWPIHNVAKVIDNITRSYNVDFHIYYGPSESKLVAELNSKVHPHLTIHPPGKDPFDLTNKFYQLDLLVSNDTGPSHIACLVGVPVLTIIGGDAARFFAPWSKKSNMVFIRNNCTNCKWRCDDTVRECIQRIEVDDVFNELIKSVAKK